LQYVEKCFYNICLKIWKMHYIDHMNLW
jgi:hypothetical protein